jgi:hypothetical protein
MRRFRSALGVGEFEGWSGAGGRASGERNDPTATAQSERARPLCRPPPRRAQPRPRRRLCHRAASAVDGPAPAVSGGHQQGHPAHIHARQLGVVPRGRAAARRVRARVRIRALPSGGRASGPRWQLGGARSSPAPSSVRGPCPLGRRRLSPRPVWGCIAHARERSQAHAANPGATPTPPQRHLTHPHTHTNASDPHNHPSPTAASASSTCSSRPSAWP